MSWKVAILGLATAIILIAVLGCMRLRSGGARAAQAVVQIEMLDLETGEARRATGWVHLGVIHTAGHLLYGHEQSTTGLVAIWPDGHTCQIIAVEVGQASDVAVLVPDCDPGRGLRVSDRSPRVGERLCYTHMRTGQPVEQCGELLESAGQWLVIDVSVVPGESGSPVYDSRGSVVGIISRGSDDVAIALRIQALEVI